MNANHTTDEPMPNGGPPETPMTVKEAARTLAVSPRVIYRLLVAGRLPGHKIGGAWRLNRRKIEALAQPHERLPAAVARTELAERAD
jgi:excisionase family DNA binding protein